MQPLSSNDPKTVGSYRIIAGLGHGAMGRVLLGVGPDRRPVAVKLIREWLVDDAQFRARFRREVAASLRVAGAYTAAVLDTGPDDPVPWLASEFLLGPTLHKAVDATGPLPEEAVLRLAAGLASALDSIHRADVVHRDLKPGNVILAADGPRVIDFGIARAAEGSGSDLTRTGGVIGTPGFMSPEQAEATPLTAASDVFSLGSVLVMACTGTSPFAAASTLRTLNNVVRADPDLADVPARIRPIAERCLAREPGDRPTPAEVLALVGPVAPSPRPWPEAVSAMTDRQYRELVGLLDGAGEDTTLIDAGRTMVTNPGLPTWVEEPPAAPASPVADPAPVRRRPVAPTMPYQPHTRPGMYPGAMSPPPRPGGDGGRQWLIAIIAIIAVVIGGAGMAVYLVLSESSAFEVGQCVHHPGGGAAEVIDCAEAAEGEDYEIVEQVDDGRECADAGRDTLTVGEDVYCLRVVGGENG